MIADEFLFRQVRCRIVANVRRSLRKSLCKGITVPSAVNVEVPDSFAVDEQRGVEIGASRFVLDHKRLAPGAPFIAGECSKYDLVNGGLVWS